tara:strand:- start:93705 stop:95528 length:1824 start_codon:yes stop_codon:yes gene_type:complete
MTLAKTVASQLAKGSRLRRGMWGNTTWGISCLFLGILFGYPALAHNTSLGSANDWDQHLLYHWVPYVSVVDHGEFPMWNPWACGGTPLLANPQARYLSPFFLLHLLFGPVVGLHLEIVLHLAIMAGGGWFLAREFGMQRLGRAAVALIFLGTSAHYLHLAMGHTWALSYAYLPWIFAFTWRALKSSSGTTYAAFLWPSMIAGALIASVIYEGGIYPAPQAALLVGLLCLGTAVARRRLQPLLVAVVAGLTAAGLAAPKLLPTLKFMAQFPRRTDAVESTNLGLLYDSLFARNQFIGRAVPPQGDGITWGFHEYGAYIGLPAALLVLAALFLLRKRVLGVALLSVFFLVLACGQMRIGDSSFGLWQLLHLVPPFASQHVPSRFLVPFVLCIAVLAGFGADALHQRFGRRGLVAALALICVGALDAWTVGPPNLWRMYDSPLGPPDTAAEFHHEWWGDTNLMMPLASSNRGALHCYEAVYLPIAAQMPGEGFRGEEFLEDGGDIHRTYWGPNALDFEIRDGPATVLVVNQNFYSGWTAEPQGRVFSLEGRLAVEVPAGTTKVSLRYQSNPFRIGLLAAFLTLLLGVWVRRRARRNPVGRNPEESDLKPS